MCLFQGDREQRCKLFFGPLCPENVLQNNKTKGQYLLQLLGMHSYFRHMSPLKFSDLMITSGTEV